MADGRLAEMELFCCFRQTQVFRSAQESFDFLNIDHFLSVLTNWTQVSLQIQTKSGSLKFSAPAVDTNH